MRALQPRTIGMGACQLVLHLGVGDDAALFEIDEQHLAGLQAPFGDDLFFRDRQHAHLGGHHHETVVGDDVAGRPEPVAVERRADLASVGEGHGGRAVPRLHQRRVIFVEGAAFLVHQRIARPGFGDQHHHRMGERIAALHEEFEGIVETGRIRLAFVGDRPELGDVGPVEVGGDRGLPRRHPIDIAAQRIDLAVVGDHPIGMGERPGRKRIGREALMDEGERRLEPPVAQILEIIAELGGEQHALVDERARRQRHRIEARGAPIGEVEDMYSR